MREHFHIGFALALNGFELIVPLGIKGFAYYDVVAGFAAGLNYNSKPDWMLK